MGHKVVWLVSAAGGVVWTPTHYKLRLSILVIAALSPAGPVFSFIVKHYANVELSERESKVVGGCPSLERGFSVYILTHSLMLSKNIMIRREGMSQSVKKDKLNVKVLTASHRVFV